MHEECQAGDPVEFEGPEWLGWTERRRGMIFITTARLKIDLSVGPVTGLRLSDLTSFTNFKSCYFKVVELSSRDLVPLPMDGSSTSLAPNIRCQQLCAEISEEINKDVFQIPSNAPAVDYPSKSTVGRMRC